MPKALGLVETRGLVAAIEAADAMIKAANVTLIGKERTDPALITIKVVGETAAVRSAVDAGAAAAGRIGVLVSTHIIPQPDLQMISLLPEIEEEKNTVKANERKSPSGDTKKAKQVLVEEKPKAKVKPEKKNEEKKKSYTATDTISRLRNEALGIEEETKRIKNEQAKSASPPGSKRIKMEEIEILNVHQLRRLARSIEDFPIQGREISRANRNELLDYFKKLT